MPREHAQLVAVGTEALKANDIDKLRAVVANLDSIRIGSAGEDDMMAGQHRSELIMALDAWLPIGFKLPDGAKVAHRTVRWRGLADLRDDGRRARADRAGHAGAALAVEAGLIDEGTLMPSSSATVNFERSPARRARRFARQRRQVSRQQGRGAWPSRLALKATRDIDPESALQDALYVEKITRLLPTYSISSRTGDDVVLGYWLTGGTNIPATPSAACVSP
jgi:cell division protease FtsH